MFNVPQSPSSCKDGCNVKTTEIRPRKKDAMVGEFAVISGMKLVAKAQYHDS